MKKLILPLKQKWLCLAAASLLVFTQQLNAQDEFEGKEEVDTSFANKNFDKHTQLVKLKKSYLIGDGISFRSAMGSLTISPTMQTQFELTTPNKNLTQMSSSFGIARSRITVVANLFDKKFNLITRINLPSNNQSVTTGRRAFNTTLQEAYFEYRPNIKHTFNIGLRADYGDTRELRCQGENLGFVTRSAVSESFDAIFDYGIRYKGNYRLGGKHLLRPYLSITTGDARASFQRNFGGYRYSVRIDYLPFDKFSQGGEYYWDDLVREQKPKLVIGVVYNYNDGASSATGTNGGRWLYGDAKQKIILPNTTRWIADFLFKYQGFYALGSYSTTRASVPTGIAGEFRLNGTFNTYSSTQTPQQIENTVRSRLNLGAGYSLQAGYILASDIAFGFRYATITNEANAAAFANYNKFYTMVVSKYLYKHDLKIQAELGFDEFQQQFKTASSSGNYAARILATIQL